ncbi:hypothetical protein C1J04_04405 [Sulfitobacter sp. SK025]|nr:hypothetical protein C1J04_04405 [Sulfitobacter sp. SK025]
MQLLCILSVVLQQQANKTVLSNIQTFLKNQSGAVTVDWVILCAAIVTIAVGAIVAVTTQTKDYADEIATRIPSDI